MLSKIIDIDEASTATLILTSRGLSILFKQHEGRRLVTDGKFPHEHYLEIKINRGSPQTILCNREIKSKFLNVINEFVVVSVAGQ